MRDADAAGWGGTAVSAACAPSGTECLGSLGPQGTCGREAGVRNVLCCLYLTPFCSLHLGIKSGAQLLHVLYPKEL